MAANLQKAGQQLVLHLVPPRGYSARRTPGVVA
jgi:hypothetical protein